MPEVLAHEDIFRKKVRAHAEPSDSLLSHPAGTSDQGDEIRQMDPRKASGAVSGAVLRGLAGSVSMSVGWGQVANRG